MVLIAGCAQHRSAPASSPSPNPVLAAVISTGNLELIKQKVAASALSASQKVAFLQMVRQHTAKPAALNGKTVGEMIVEEHAYAMALRMTAADRAADRAHRLAMAALVAASAVAARSTGSTFNVELTVRNKTRKTIKTLDCGIEVRDAGGARLGTAEFDVDRIITPHASVRVTVGLPYAKFGGDAATVRNARGRHLTIVLDIKQLAYSGGGEAGSGD